MSKNILDKYLDEIASTLENEANYRWVESDQPFERILIKNDTHIAFLITVTVRPIQ